jgi:hypothetical protein
MKRVRLFATIVSLYPVFLTGSFPAYAQARDSTGGKNFVLKP